MSVVSSSAPPLHRRRGLVAGVASGLARHLGWSVWIVRLLFVVSTVAAGFGVISYCVFWIVLPPDPNARSSSLRMRIERLLALLVAGAAAVTAMVQSPTSRLLLAPLLACIGGAIIWMQAGALERRRLLALSQTGLRAGGTRIVVGAALVIGGCAIVVSRASLSSVRDALIAMATTLVGIVVISGPWWVRVVNERNTERRERIRSQERAELAARVHDSVLQTLTLIQRNSHDPREVIRLSRGQERELREVLYGAASGPGRLHSALADAAAEIEGEYGVEVQVVVVGDAELDERLEAVVAATREAMVNSAKHSGVQSMSLFAEVHDDAAVTFVRDRGTGFQLELVSADRHGVRGSIIGRVERFNGTAAVRSSAERGTEIEIRMPR